MPEPKSSYFGLGKADQIGILTGMAAQLGVREAILEKDIWLCLALEKLFQLQGAESMVFKGGTSLSKVYRAIERFSEDVDVTIDWRTLHSKPPSREELKVLSKNKLGKLKEEITELLCAHVEQRVKPELQRLLAEVRNDISVEFERGADGEPVRDKLRVYYPAVAEQGDHYIPASILIEFGARNPIEPGEAHTIVPAVAEYVPAVDFPSAKVNVLSPQRTFWEKATLIHDECHRPAEKAKPNASRMSRHWYDLVRLADHEIGPLSVQNFELLKQVIEVKTLFFSYGFSRYDLCDTGQLRLVPEGALLDALKADYQAMLDAAMFYGVSLSFEEIVARLTALETEINKRAHSVNA